MKFTFYTLQFFIIILLSVNLIIFISFFLFLRDTLWLSLGLTLTIVFIIILILQNINWESETPIKELEIQSAIEAKPISAPEKTITEKLQNSFGELNDKLKPIEENIPYQELEAKLTSVITAIKEEIDKNSLDAQKFPLISEIENNLIQKISQQISNKYNELESRINNVLEEIPKISSNLNKYNELELRVNNILEEIPKISRIMNKSLEDQLSEIKQTLMQSIESIKSEISIERPPTSPPLGLKPPAPTPPGQSAPPPPPPIKSNFLSLNGREVPIVQIPKLNDVVNIKGENYKLQRTIYALDLSGFKNQGDKIAKMFKEMNICICKANNESSYYLYYETKSQPPLKLEPKPQPPGIAPQPPISRAEEPARKSEESGPEIKPGELEREEQEEDVEEVPDSINLNGKEVRIIQLKEIVERFKIKNMSFKLQHGIQPPDLPSLLKEADRIQKLFRDRNICICWSDKDDYYHVYYEVRS